jgi:hypothetical protein
MLNRVFHDMIWDIFFPCLSIPFSPLIVNRWDPVANWWDRPHKELRVRIAIVWLRGLITRQSISRLAGQNVYRHSPGDDNASITMRLPNHKGPGNITSASVSAPNQGTSSLRLISDPATHLPKFSKCFTEKFLIAIVHWEIQKHNPAETSVNSGAKVCSFIMTNKGQSATMANIEGRLGDEKISSDTIMHPKQTNANRTLRETENIPVQILLDMIVYLIKNLIYVFSFRSWIYLSSSP